MANRRMRSGAQNPTADLGGLGSLGSLMEDSRKCLVGAAAPNNQTK